jgi:hypothetical protein
LTNFLGPAELLLAIVSAPLVGLAEQLNSALWGVEPWQIVTGTAAVSLGQSHSSRSEEILKRIGFLYEKQDPDLTFVVKLHNVPVYSTLIIYRFLHVLRHTVVKLT